jgi:hypothetical protein
VGDEVCYCVVEELLKQSFFCRDFASMKKIVAIGRPTPFLTKTAKQLKNSLRHFSDSWYKTDPWLCGCKKSSLYFGIVSFFKLKEIFERQTMLMTLLVSMC